MTMLDRLPIALLSVTLLVPLASCAGPPQQPTDVVDDRSAIQADPDAAEADPFGAASPFEPGPGPNDAADDTATGTVQPRQAQPGSALATQAEVSAITGSWAIHESDCGRVTEVTVTEERFAGLDRACDISSAISGGAGGSVTLSLECTGPGGEFESELLTLTPLEDGAMMDVNVVGGETPQRLARCP